MTRVPIKGQDADIEAIITRMYERYMKPEESILLNVVSAMVDFTTSKSLSMSQSMDPTAQRSLLCITKIDQLREGGLARSINAVTEGLSIPSEHIFCVRNRSQSENDACIALDEIRRKEREYFMSSEELREKVGAHNKGIGELSKRLVVLQFERISGSLPILRKKLESKIELLQGELDKHGVILDNEFMCRSILQQRLLDCTRRLHDEATGRAHSKISAQPENLMIRDQLEGREIELEICLDDLNELRKMSKPNELKKRSEESIKGVTFGLRVCANALSKEDEDSILENGSASCHD
jgi:hypothetical protein